MPSWLPPTAVECAAGRFPQGREDELRRLGTVWSDRAEDCRAKAREHEDAARSPSDARGEFASAIEEKHRRLAERYHKLAAHCESLDQGLLEYAKTIELMKITVIGILVILTVALARCALMFAAGGAIEAAVQRMAARTAIQAAWKKSLQFLTGRLAQLAAERGGIALVGHALATAAIQGGGLNLVAQGIQVAEGNRQEIDGKAVGVATAGGIAGGMLGLLAARWLGPKVGAYTAGIESTGRRVTMQLAGTAAIGGLGGVGGAVAGTAVSLGLTGEAFTAKAFTEAMMPGLVGGAIIAGGYAARDIRAATQAFADTGKTSPPIGPGEASPSGLFDALAARGLITRDFDPAVSSAAQHQQNEQFFSLLQEANTATNASLPEPVTNKSGEWRPTGVPHVSVDNVSPVKSADFRSGSGTASEPAAPAENGSVRKVSVQPTEAPVVRLPSSTTPEGTPIAASGADGGAHPTPRVADRNDAGTAEPAQTGTPRQAEPGPAAAPPQNRGPDGTPPQTRGPDGTQREAGPHEPAAGASTPQPPGEAAAAARSSGPAGEPSPPSERPHGAASDPVRGPAPRSTEMSDGPAQPVPVVPVAEAHRAQVVVPEASATPRGASGRSGGGGDGPGAVGRQQPPSGEALRTPTPRTGAPGEAPAVSAPKAAASERPSLVDSAVTRNRPAEDGAALPKSADVETAGRKAPTPTAEEPESHHGESPDSAQWKPATIDDNSGKNPTPAGEPEPLPVRADDDSTDRQQDKNEPRAADDEGAPPPESEPARARDDSDAPPAPRDDDAADPYATAKAEVEQRIAGERQQNELVREHHRQRVDTAAELERAAHTELQRREEAVRVAQAHERATRLDPADHLRELSGPADRVAVEAARAAQEQLRHAQVKLTESRDAYEAAVAAHDAAARARARDLVDISDNAGLSLMKDFEAGVLTDRAAVFEVVAQERVRTALDAGRAIGALRDPGTADGTSPMTHASARTLVDTMVGGSREERIAAMTEWIRRGDDRHRLVRETQAAAYLLLEHGPVDMKTGEGKTIVMVMKMVSDAVDHGTAHAWTSSDLLAGELAGEVRAFVVRPESDTGIDVVRMDQDGPLPDPVPGRRRIIVGTKEDYLFRALKVADSMIGELGAKGMPHQEVTALRDFLNTKPSIDLIKERLETAASDHGLDTRFDPFPAGKLTIDEFDTIFDGNSECVLSPGAAKEATPEVVAQLQGIWDRLAIAEREHGLTAADFKRPENTRGMWAAETTPAAVAKLDKVAGEPVTVAELKLFADAANARWGLERGTHYVTRADEGEGAKIGVLAYETNDKAMWDRTKSTEVRWQDVGQFVDLKEGLPVRANQEHSLRMSDQQLIGSKVLFDPSGLSGTMKGVEGITYDLYGVGPVPELPTFYTSNRIVEKPLDFANTQDKLMHLAGDIVRDADIVDGVQTGRPQWITLMDNGEGRGDPAAGRLGLVDYLHQAARERYGDDFELRFVMVDAEFYAEHGGSNVHSEALVRQMIEEFGKPGDIFIINKEGGRGADPTPTKESIALGGVLGKTSGGPAFSDRVNDQVDGRVARGGSGADRENGGTPGTTVHYISPEDFRGRVTDHGVTQQIVKYTNAIEAHRLAQERHEQLNTKTTEIELNNAELFLEQARTDLLEKAVPAMKDAVEREQLATKYASAEQANAPPAEAHGTATRQPPHPPPQLAETTVPHTTGNGPHTTPQHAPATDNGIPGPAVAGRTAWVASSSHSGNLLAPPNLRDEHGDSTLRHLLQVLDAPGGQAAAPLLPVAQAVRDTAFEQVEAQGVPIGTDVADHMRETARNLLDAGLNQLDPAQRRLVTDTGTALQQGRALTPAQAAAVTQLVEQVRTAQPILADAPDITIPFDPVPARDRTEMLHLAQQGDPSAGQALDRDFGPATARGVLAVLGWDPERGTPPAPLQVLAHAVARATLGAADTGGWQVPPGMDIGDWLLGEATDIWLDGYKQLNSAARRLVTDALNSRSRDDLTDTPVAALFEWVAQEIAVRAADSAARQQRSSAEDRTTRANAAATADSERNTKQAIARHLFETYGVEVLGLDKRGISVDTALSIRNAIVDGYAARKNIDDIQLDVVLIAPMVGNIGGCIWSPDVGVGTAPTLMVLNEDLFGDPEKFQKTMRKAAQAGRLMAPTGDPAYDAVSHEMGHLRDKNARKGLHDRFPMDHSRIGPIREESSSDSKEARAFGYLFSHFTELKRFGSLPPGAQFDDWLGQLDAYSRGRKKSRNPEEDRLFEAFESWLSRFESRADFDEWLRESGVSRQGIDDRRRSDPELPEGDDGSGWVDLNTLYKTWLNKLDENTRRLIHDGKEYGRPPTRRDPDAAKLGLDAAKLALGALEVFNPAEALAEANNAFGRSAPADPTHPVYALQALLRGVSYAQVLKDAEQRNALVQVDYRGPVPAASEFGASIASKGPTASVAEAWRSKTPAERARYVKQQVTYLNPSKGGRPGFVLDELVRLEEQQRADLASQQERAIQQPAATPGFTAHENSSTAEPQSRTRELAPVATDLDDPDTPENEETAATAHSTAAPVPGTHTALQRAQQGGAEAAEAFRELREEYGRGALAQVLAELGIPATAETPELRPLRQMAQQLNRMAFQIAEAHRWHADPGVDPGEWLHRIVHNLVDGWFGLNATQRGHAFAAAAAIRRGENIDLLQRGVLNRLVHAGQQDLTRAGTRRAGTGWTAPSRITEQPERSNSPIEPVAPPTGRDPGSTTGEPGNPEPASSPAARRGNPAAQPDSESPAIAVSGGSAQQGNRPLSKRQRAILDLVAQGKTNAEIAEHLEISEGAVKSQVKRIYDRLGVSDREQLIGAEPESVADSRERGGTRPLSNTELDILRLMVLGTPNADIASHLDIPGSTVNSYVKRIYDKLGVSDRRDLVGDTGTFLAALSNRIDRPLSARQNTVLRLVTQGLTNAEIAKYLHVTEETVKSYVTLIRGKLGVANRSDLVAATARAAMPNRTVEADVPLSAVSGIEFLDLRHRIVLAYLVGNRIVPSSAVPGLERGTDAELVQAIIEYEDDIELVDTALMLAGSDQATLFRARSLLDSVQQRRIDHAIAAVLSRGRMSHIQLTAVNKLAMAVRSASSNTAQAAAATVHANALSDIERDIVGLVAASKTNEEIAHEIRTTDDFVRKAIARIRRKLGAADRTHAVVQALRRRIIRLSDIPAPDPALAYSLSDRDRRILGFLAVYDKHEEIATATGLSANSVRTSVRNIIRIFDARTQTEAVVRALWVAALDPNDIPIARSEPTRELTERELDALGRFAAGQRSGGIAGIARAVGASGRTETVVRALRLGYLFLEDIPLANWLVPLTPREKAILRLVAAGLSNSRIASRLHLSPETVKSALPLLYRKLRVGDRTGAVVEALRRGEIDLDSIPVSSLQEAETEAAHSGDRAPAPGNDSDSAALDLDDADEPASRPAARPEAAVSENDGSAQQPIAAQLFTSSGSEVLPPGPDIVAIDLGDPEPTPRAPTEAAPPAGNRQGAPGTPPGSPGAQVPGTAALLQLLQRYIAQGRRDEAIAVLNRQYGDKVFRWVSTGFSEPRVAREITDEAIEAGVDRLARIPDRNVEKWVVFIARNLMPKHARFAQFRQRIDQAFIDAGGAEELRGPLASATTSELQRALRAGTLSDQQRAALNRFLPDPRRGGTAEPVSAGNLATSDRALRSAVRAFVLAIAADRGDRTITRAGSVELTSLQVELLRLAARGAPNHEIAERWGISTSQVSGKFLAMAQQFGLDVRASVLNTAHHWFSDSPGSDPAVHPLPDERYRTMTVGEKELYRTLTEAEKELFRMATAGDTDSEIAQRWGISGRDVAARWLQIADKLGVEYRNGLVEAAARAGVAVSPQPDAPVGRRSGAEQPGISETHIEILRLIAAGLPDKQIERYLNRSARWVESQLKVAAQILGTVGNRSAILAFAIRNGIIDPPEPGAEVGFLEPRDFALIELAAQGRSEREIGKLVGRTGAAIGEYFRDISILLDTNTRAQLIAMTIAVADSRQETAELQGRLRELFPPERPAPQELPDPGNTAYDGIHQWLKDLRDYSGITQVQFAELTGMAAATVSRIMRGISRPSIVALRRMRDRLGLPDEVLRRAVERFYARSRAKAADPAIQRLFWELIATEPGSREEKEKQKEIFQEYAYIPVATAPGWAESDAHRQDLVQLGSEEILTAILNFAPVDDFTALAWSAARYACMDDYFSRRFPDMGESMRKLVMSVDTYTRRIGESNEISDIEIARALDLDLVQVARARAILEQRLDASRPLSKKLMAVLRRALAELPDVELAVHVVRLRFFEDLPVTRVARRCDISPASAEDILDEALPKIRAAFRPLGTEGGPTEENTVADAESVPPGPIGTAATEPDHVELSEGEWHIVRLVAGLAAAGGTPARSLAAVLGLTSEQTNRLLVRLDTKLAGATAVHKAPTAQQNTAAGHLQLSPTQLADLRMLTEELPDQIVDGTTALPSNTLQAFRAHLASRAGGGLSRGEIEVLNLFMQGHTATAAAAILDVPRSTVTRYFAGCQLKLRTHGVIPTVLAAVRAGVLDNTGRRDAVELSRMEARALRLVAEGRTNESIAAELGVGTPMRRRLMGEIYSKFGVDSKLGLALEAQARGLLDESAPGPVSPGSPQSPWLGRSAKASSGDARQAIRVLNEHYGRVVLDHDELIEGQLLSALSEEAALAPQDGTGADTTPENPATPWSGRGSDTGTRTPTEPSAATDSAYSTPVLRRTGTIDPSGDRTEAGATVPTTDIPEHVRLCLVQTVRAAWAIGYDEAGFPADDAETWKDLEDSLYAGFTRVPVPEGIDPRAAIARVLDTLEDPANGISAVAFVVDSGQEAHSFLATSEGKSKTLIFDTNIPAPPTTSSDAGKPIRRTPRVRDRETWEQDFPDTFPVIADVFTLEFTSDANGRLQPEPATDRQGPTDEQRRHLIHGEPSTTPEPPEEPVPVRKLFVVNKPFVHLLLGTPTLPGGEVGRKLGSTVAASALPYALMNAEQSPAVAALAGAAVYVPRLLDPHAGRVADRSDRRRVMLRAQWVGAAAAAATTGLFLFDAPHLGMGVGAATFVEATAAAYYFRAFQAVTGDFLTPAQRPPANDLRNITGSTAEATGQALGPGLVGIVPGVPFALNLLTTLTNLENTRRLSFPRQTFGEPRNLFRDIGDGARALWQEKFLREYTAIATLNNAAWAMMGFRTATVLEASDLPGLAIGAVVAAPAVGGMMSGVLSKITRNVEATTFYPAALGNMALFFALQAATTNPAAIAAATFADSLVMWAMNSRIASYEQGAFPSEIRGRAGGVKGLFLGIGPAAGMFAASALVGGAVANAHSGDALAALAATISAVTAAGYAVVLFVRKGRVFYRIVGRGRGLFGRRPEHPAEIEAAPAPSQTPAPEVIENCAIHIARVHRALGDDNAAQPVDTDPRWKAKDNWRITEEILGAQLRLMKTRGADPVATAVEIIRDPKNAIDRAAVAVDGHIHYIVAVDGLREGEGRILVFDTLIDDTEDTLRVRSVEGDENGDNKWQPSYTSHRRAFAAYFTTTDGVPTPARRSLAGFLPRRHPVQLLGRSEGDELSPEQARQLAEQHIGPRLSPAETGEWLRDELRRITGNPDVEVSGFDRPDLHPETVREIARALVDLATRYPQVAVPRVEIGWLPVQVGGRAKTKISPVTGAVTTEDLRFNADFAADPNRLQQWIQDRVDSGKAHPSMLARPAYAIVAHEFGHLADTAGQWEARYQVGQMLFDHYKAKPQAEKSYSAFLSWLRHHLTVYSFHKDGDFNPTEALAEAFAEVVLNGRERVSEPVGLMYDLLVGSIVSPHTTTDMPGADPAPAPEPDQEVARITARLRELENNLEQLTDGAGMIDPTVLLGIRAEVDALVDERSAARPEAARRQDRTIATLRDVISRPALTENDVRTLAEIVPVRLGRISALLPGASDRYVQALRTAAESLLANLDSDRPSALTVDLAAAELANGLRTSFDTVTSKLYSGGGSVWNVERLLDNSRSMLSAAEAARRAVPDRWRRVRTDRLTPLLSESARGRLGRDDIVAAVTAELPAPVPVSSAVREALRRAEQTVVRNYTEATADGFVFRDQDLQTITAFEDAAAKVRAAVGLPATDRDLAAELLGTAVRPTTPDQPPSTPGNGIDPVAIDLEDPDEPDEPDPPQQPSDPESAEPTTARGLLAVNKPFGQLLLGKWYLPAEVGNIFGTSLASAAAPYALLNAGQSPGAAAIATAAGWLAKGAEPLAGRAADRSDRRQVMLRAQAIAGTAAVIPFGMFLFDAPHLATTVAAASLVEGVAAAYYFRAFQAAAKDLLPTDEQRIIGNELRNVTGSTASVTGTALGPGLAGLAPAAPFGVNALSYLTNWVNVKNLSLPPQTFSEPQSLFRDIATGVRTLRDDRFLGPYAVVTAINNAAFAMMGFRTATVVEASDLGWVAGAVVAAPAIGGIMSGFVSKLARKVELSTFYPLALGNMAVGLGVQAATTDPAVIAAATFWDSMVMWTLLAKAGAYEQKVIPSEKFGRVGGVKAGLTNVPAGAGLFVASGLVGGAAANVHSGDTVAALAATISATAAAGYGLLLFVRHGRIFFRIVARRGRGLFGRGERPAEAETATEPTQIPAGPSADSPTQVAPDTPAPAPEVVTNCALHVSRVHRALGDDAIPEPAETDPRWNAEDNWRIIEEALGAQLRPMKTRGLDPIAIAVETIRNKRNKIDSAAVTVAGHIHYVVNVEGQILVFDTRIDDTADDTLHVRNYDGDENGENKWTPWYDTFETAFVAYFKSTDGIPTPARRRLPESLHRKHPAGGGAVC